MKPRIDWRVWAALLVILGLAAVLRLINLRQFPGWYADEGVFINTSQNLLDGRWQIFPVQASPMLIQRPPLFTFTVSGVFMLLGSDILSLRLLSVFYSLLDIGLLFWMVRRAWGAPLALAAAGMLAILPEAVAHQRLGYSYHQMGPLLLLSLTWVWLYLETGQRKWGLLAVIPAALCLATDYLGAIVLVVVLGVLLFTNWRIALAGLGVTLVVLALVVLPVILVNPAQFWADVSFPFGAKTGGGLPEQLLAVIFNLGEFIRRETWLVLGIVGLFLLPAGKLRTLILVTFGLTFLAVLRTFPPVGRGLHYLHHLLPFFGLGLGAFILSAWRKLIFILRETLGKGGGRWALAARKATSGVILAGVVGVPLVWMLLADAGLALYGANFLFSGNNDLGLTSAQDVDAAAAYLRQNANPQAGVVGSPQVLWALPLAQKSDWSTTLLADGMDAGAQPANLVSRLAYDCSLKAMSYAVVDGSVESFARAIMPGMTPLLTEIYSWPVAFESGEVKIYRNPQVQP